MKGTNWWCSLRNLLLLEVEVHNIFLLPFLDNIDKCSSQRLSEQHVDPAMNLCSFGIRCKLGGLISFSVKRRQKDFGCHEHFTVLMMHWGALVLPNNKCCFQTTQYSKLHYRINHINIPKTHFYIRLEFYQTIYIPLWILCGLYPEINKHNSTW